MNTAGRTFQAHGDDSRRLAAALGLDPDRVLDLAQSLNPLVPPAGDVLARHLGSVRSYPDPARATAALADAMGVPGELLLLTNGGSEAIALVAAELGTGRVEEPEFSLYARHLEHLDPLGGLWRSNPHNPTGVLAGAAEDAAVWDEAFYPLAAGEWTRGDHRDGSIVVGSLTKLLACPGLRAGYVLAPDRQLAEDLAARQPRWAVNALVCAALPSLLATIDLVGWRDGIAKLRDQLSAVLRSHGLAVETGEAPWVLARGEGHLRELLAPEGVFVRDCGSFGLDGVTRIAVPDGEGLDRLDAALTRVLDGAGRVATRGCRAVPSRPGTVARLRGGIMVCGTSSDAGKSRIVAGLCRALWRSGVDVAPFKGQNMSLNSFVTPDGFEIGRAQGIQALACHLAPEVAMNPVLLKPTGERRSQVVVMGKPVGELDARAYQAAKPSLRPAVLDALSGLRRRHDVVVCEGAGSPAEINLLDGDIVNLALAAAARLPAFVVGDIERGGVFASLYGTVALLPEELRRCVRGFAINKLRGDASLLDPGVQELERRIGLPCLGVIPYVPGLDLDAEDSLALTGSSYTGTQARDGGGSPVIDVAVVRLPRIANFTDLDALALEPAVSVRFVTSPAELGDPDLIIVPGSKTTVADLHWMADAGLAAAIVDAAALPHGPVVLGVCAGYQMLGERIVDLVESGEGVVAGLGLLPMSWRFDEDKVTLPRGGRAMGAEVTGYEIHHGLPDGGRCPTWIELEAAGPPGSADASGHEGGRRDDGRVLGTSLHGLFESDAFRSVFLSEVAARRSKAWQPSGVSFAGAREAQIEKLADLVDKHLDLDAIRRIIASAPPLEETA